MMFIGSRHVDGGFNVNQHIAYIMATISVDHGCPNHQYAFKYIYSF